MDAADKIHLMPIQPRAVGMRPKRFVLWDRAGGKCHWCGCMTRLVADNSWDKATIDHVLPRYKGGTNDDANLVLACNLCNNRRSHEDQMGLADGSLLNKYKTVKHEAIQKRKHAPKNVSLTKDDKRAIFHRMDQEQLKREKHIVELIAQKDNALAIVQQLHRTIEELRTANEELTVRIESMTVWTLVRKKIANRIWR